MNDNIGLAVTLLITGLVVVFIVLILLIGVIKLYSTIVYNAQNKNVQKIAAKQEEERRLQDAQAQQEKPPVLQTPAAEGDTIPRETIAVIAAAVEAVYGKGQAKIKGIKKLSQTRPVWSTAGLMDNTRPF